MKKMNLKGKVKVLTEITYGGIEKDGQVAKKGLVGIIRRSFNSQGFVILLECFESLSMDTLTHVAKYQYNQKGQLLEMSSGVEGTEKTTYSYNERGDRTLERKEDPTREKPLDKEYHYEYTPEGKKEIVLLAVAKNTYYYDQKNRLVKEEHYDTEEGMYSYREVNTYNEEDFLIKKVSVMGDTPEVTTTYTYDKYGNLTTSVSKSTDGGSKEVYKYQYDNRGNILKEDFKFTSTYMEIFDSSYLKTYTYDAQGNKITEIERESHSREIVITEYEIEYY